MVDLIADNSSLSKADIKVMGNPAYIAADSPTSGKKVMIEMVVPASAAATSSVVLNKVKSDNILGIFCSNEATVKGLLAATNDGAALPVSYPGLVVIGYKAVELAYKAYMGEAVADVDTEAKFYNKDNMDDDDIKGLLYD